jgi:hypothetical protein
MRLDASLMFVPNGGPALSMVAGAGVNVSSNVIDLFGLGVGVAPSNQIIGNVTLWGSDLGVGGGDANPRLQITIGTAFVTANACTLNLALQMAPDSLPNHQPGAWQTINETGALTAAQLTANQIIARFDWPPAFPSNLQPRYAKLLGQVPAATNFTAGTISFAGVTLVRDDYNAANAARNYTVA